MAEHVQKSPSTSNYIERKKHRPLTVKFINHIVSLLGFLLMAWFMSIVVEWGGMLLFWSDQGSLHSQEMLRQELGYLNDEFSSSVIGAPPVQTAYTIASTFKYYVFEWTHIIDFFEWIKTVPSGSGNFRILAAHYAGIISEYFQALINTSLVFAVRVTVATLALPAFILVGIAAMVDGLVQRELRIYGGGIERAMVYHHAKPWIKPAILSTWFFYIGMPFSIHPNLIFVPAIAVFGAAIFTTSALFKKHL